MMSTVTFDDFQVSSEYKHISGYFTVIRDLMSRVQSEVEHHQEVLAICKTLDALTEITKTADFLLEEAFKNQDDLSLPVEIEALFNGVEKGINKTFDKALTALASSDFPWHTRGKQKQLRNKLTGNRDALLRLISHVQRFSKADEWDLKMMQQIRKDDFKEILLQHPEPFVFTTKDWNTFISSLDEDDIKPTQKMSQAVKDYRTLLSA